MRRKLLCLILLLITDLSAMAPFVPQLGWPSADALLFPALSPVLHPSQAFVPLLWIAVMAREGLYVRRNRRSTELRHLARALVIALTLLLALRPLQSPALSVLELIYAGLMMIVAVAIGRLLVKPMLYRLGLWRKEVVLIGAGTTGRRLIDALAGDRFTGLDIVAALDDDPALQDTRVRDVPVVGTLDRLETLLEAPGAASRDLLVAIPSLPRERLQRLIGRSEGRVESIRFVPDLLGLSTLGVELESLRGTPAIRLKQNLMKPWNAAAKRGLDVAAGLILVCLLMPVSVVLCLIIALETPGSPVLVQARLGRRGRLFSCVKFRTMYVDADARLAVALAGDPALRGEWEAYAKLRGRDPRVTPLGRWLRRFSLDELPQLWNVLRGDMSLIGPRPYLPREAPRIGEALSVIGAARPGLTGLWQVSGRNELTFQERLELDEYYVRNWTVGMDLWILLRTVGALLSGRGAY
jgi:undecaprenyl-phosphate galactose phosphotransferase